ncbi:MAG TPA: hypothetical protein VNT01_10565 [Symbiobacteriaceae bacterium]|nr:hypothetical protein [Symbiobacteriaceae bacterium]
MSYLRWWSGSYAVFLGASTFCAAVRSPVSLSWLGLLVVMAYQSLLFVLGGSLVAWAVSRPFRHVAARLVTGSALGAGIVLWLEPQPWLVVVGAVAGVSGGLLSEPEDWLLKSAWLTVLCGVALGAVGGMVAGI